MKYTFDLRLIRHVAGVRAGLAPGRGDLRTGRLGIARGNFEHVNIRTVCGKFQGDCAADTATGSRNRRELSGQTESRRDAQGLLLSGRVLRGRF